MRSIEPRTIRNKSLKEASRLGYITNDALPLLERPDFLRPMDSVRRRMLATYGVLVALVALPRREVLMWVSKEHLNDELTRKEKQFFDRGTHADQLKVEIESLWTLAWCTGLVDMDFGKPSRDEVASYFPNIAKGEPSANYLKELRLRELSEIQQACDVAYCIHWAIRQAHIEGQMSGGRLPPAYVVERRRALEWMLHDESWDDISLDT
jgi:hypothetical protein